MSEEIITIIKELNKTLLIEDISDAQDALDALLAVDSSKPDYKDFPHRY